MKRVVLTVILIISLTMGCSSGQETKKAVENQNKSNKSSVIDSANKQKNQEKSNDGYKDQKEERNKSPELPGAVLVMVDNYAKARPQSGLDKADAVFEIMAEGGITRLMAVYYSVGADTIGPVRSARYYFVELAKGFNAPLAHAGGSQEALELIQKINIKDLDEIYNAGGCFWRDNKRKMPHNLYTSTDKLIKGAKNKNYKLVTPPLIKRGNIELTEKKDGKNITIDYKTGVDRYSVNWKYNEKQNEYERFINNKPHKMSDGICITADNVIIIVAETRTYIKDNVPLSDVKIVGGGEARYFIDGKAYLGSWKKDSVSKPVRFFNADGGEMVIKEGNVWVQVVPALESMIIKE